jgi:uncharacterized protein YndB with AHSA1/START domain
MHGDAHEQDDTTEHASSSDETRRDQPAVAARFEEVIDLEVSLDVAWEAISDPRELTRWLGSSVDLDVRPGGRGRIVDDDGTVRDVIVTDVRPGEQVAWHWWSDGGELSSVELRIDELDGHTRLRIVETSLLPAARADAVPTLLGGCTRRWSAATSRLWRHVGATAFA